MTAATRPVLATQLSVGMVLVVDGRALRITSIQKAHRNYPRALEIRTEDASIGADYCRSLVLYKDETAQVAV
jgi:translation elongation factor P/translation initiation factor 5A